MVGKITILLCNPLHLRQVIDMEAYRTNTEFILLHRLLEYPLELYPLQLNDTGK